MKNNISYVFRNGNKKIEVFPDRIEVTSNPYVFEVVKLTHNNDYVLKFNKTSISTCNIEYLAAAYKRT